jgi:hypothetical protein
MPGRLLCLVEQLGMPKLAMMGLELIPKSTTIWKTCEPLSNPQLSSFKARVMNVHASSTGLAPDGASSLVST